MSAILLVLLAIGGSRAEIYDAIVVGLGSAGTTAASTLAQAGKKVLGLEAQDRIGGRVNTVPFGDGIVELGAEWIHGSEDSRVYELAMKNNVSIISDRFGELAFKSDGTPADKDLLMNLLDMTEEFSNEPPPTPEPLGQYLTKRVKEYISEKYPAIANDKELVESLLYFLDLCTDLMESSASWNDLTTESHYDNMKGDHLLSWHRIGYKTFFQILLNTYKNGPGYPNLEVLLNKEVTHISWPQEPEQPVLVTCKDGSNYTAKHVIVTVSLGVLKDRYKTLFPPLPEDKVTSIEKMSMGSMAKIVLAFDKVWWPKKTFIAFLWSEKDRNSVPEEDKWTTRLNGPSFPRGSDNTLTFWVNSQDVEKVETLPEEVLKAKAMEVLRRFLSANMTITEPSAMIRSKWYTSPYTRGTYTYDNLLMPQYPKARENLGKPLEDSSGTPRVLFAGEATHPDRYSTVHGAAETGYREAMRILNLKE